MIAEPVADGEANVVDSICIDVTDAGEIQDTIQISKLQPAIQPVSDTHMSFDFAIRIHKQNVNLLGG